MSYILGGVTLKNPKDFKRKYVETSDTFTSLKGRSTKDIRNIKESFTLTFDFVNASDRNRILALYEAQEPCYFEVNETNLTILPTEVIIEIGGRDYLKGGSYLEGFNVELLEVQ